MTTSTAGRQSSDVASGAPPFPHSRLRSYANRVEGLIDPKVALSSSVALTSTGLADPFPAGANAASGSSSGPGPTSPVRQAVPSASPQQQLRPTAGSQPSSPAAASQPQRGPQVWPQSPPTQQPQPHGQPAPVASAKDLAAALSQIQVLKAEIAGVETVLGYLKGSETASATTMGRKAHKLPSQEALRQRADALAAGRAASRLNAGGDPLLSSSVNGSLGSSGVGGLGSGGSPAHGPSPGRARSAGDAADIVGTAMRASGVFESLAAETKLGRTWRLPRGPQPVGRGEAVILEAALDEALPPGAITAKYGSGGGSSAGGGTGEGAAAAGARTAVQASLWAGSGGNSAAVRRDFEMLDLVARELARQVSAQCMERGRIIEKLADRHGEIFAVITGAAREAAETQRQATEQLAAATARAAEQASEIAALRAQLAERGADASDLVEQLAEARTQHEHYVWDAEQEVEQLQGQADILAAEVEHLHVRLSEAVADKDAALSRGLARLEAQLSEVTDERDDLAQRIRFLERQLHKLRTEMNATVATSVAEVQTDPVEWGPVVEEDVPDDNSDTPSLADIRARYLAHGYNALSPEERMRLGLPPYPDDGPKDSKGKKRRRALGHFQGLISSERPGRVRGLQWTINAIAAIYYDKLQADSVADRGRNPRQRLAEFAVEWHLTRFGLRSLAELNLLDLLASVRQHYKASVRVRWFGQFTGLVEVGDSVDTTPHVSFYLHVLACLAAPNSLLSLFPDSVAAAGGGGDGRSGDGRGGSATEEATGNPPVAIKAAALPEAIKAIFKYLNEPEAAPQFLLRCCEPLTDPVTQLAPLDPLVALLMAEYQKRWERNAAHLSALFRAADYDEDGLVGYDEFVAIVRQVLPDASDRRVSKMYSEAVRRLPEGQALVDMETYLNVVRAFGCDRWRIDMGPTVTAYGTAAGAMGGTGSISPFGLLPPPGAATRGAGKAALAPSGSAASLAAALSGAAAAAAVGGGTSHRRITTVVSNLRKQDSVVGLSDQDRALLRVLDGALEGLEPPLEEQMEALLERLRASAAAARSAAAAAAAASSGFPGLEMLPGSAREKGAAAQEDNATISKLEAQYGHFRTVYEERTDPPAAWLAFRMLLASLAAATAGARVRTSPSRSRPGSARGSVPWGNTRSAIRLTVPPLPFRAGSSSARHLIASGGGTGTGAGAGAAAAGNVPGSRGVPGSAGTAGMISGGRGGQSVGPSRGGSPGVVTVDGQGGGGGSRPRSASRSPDLPGRPSWLEQMAIQGLPGGGVAPGSASLVIPSPTAPSSVHRAPLPLPMPVPVPVPLSSAGTGRGTSQSTAPSGVASTTASAVVTPGASPPRRGVVFSFVERPSAFETPIAAAAAAAVAAASSSPPATADKASQRPSLQAQQQAIGEAAASELTAAPAVESTDAEDVPGVDPSAPAAMQEPVPPMEESQ